MPTTSITHFCDSCHKEFGNIANARRHEKACARKQEKREKRQKELDELCNRTRLTCDNLGNLSQMLVQDVKDLFGKDIVINLSHWRLASNTKRETGEVHYTISVSAKGKFEPFYNKGSFGGKVCIFDIFGSKVWVDGYGLGIRGFESGGGSGGANFSYNLRLPLARWPRLNEKVIRLLGMKAKKKEHDRKVQDLRFSHENRIATEASEDLVISGLRTQIEGLQADLNRIQKLERDAVKNMRTLLAPELQEATDALDVGFSQDEYNNLVTDLQGCIKIT